MMSSGFDYDVVIVGCGVGGHGAALHARGQVSKASEFEKIRNYENLLQWEERKFSDFIAFSCPHYRASRLPSLPAEMSEEHA